MAWSLIVRALERRNVRSHLINTIRACFHNGMVMVTNKNVFHMSSGFPQGSVLRSTVWYISRIKLVEGFIRFSL